MRPLSFFKNPMKKLLILWLACVFVATASAQDKQEDKKEPQPKALANVVNTLKDRITLEGYIQLGYSYDNKNGQPANSFEMTRAILMARGRITDRWSCYFMYSLAGTPKILEAYTEYHFFPELSVRMGEFKTPYTYENPLSPTIVELVNCYSQAVNYLAGINGSDPLYGSNSGRDLGLMIYGDLFKGVANYKLALMNGQGINRKDGNNQKDIVGTFNINPLQWLTLTGSFIKGKGCAIAQSDINPDIQIGDNYTRNRWAAGLVLKLEPIALRSEYLVGKDGNVKSDGYYATANVHILPRQKIDLIASYDYLNKNKAADNKQTNYIAGLQWWFYPKCRLQVQYTRCNPCQSKSYNLVQAQVQVRF